MQGLVKHQSSRWFESSLNNAVLVCYSISRAGASQSKATVSPGAKMKCWQLKFPQTADMFQIVSQIMRVTSGHVHITR